ncbi:MAG: 1,4-alpha-glucan branching enzyme, partial [Variovorax sp.]|nr:1,4-alpha-glucan branching enzyme [Variovorax sp.]
FAQRREWTHEGELEWWVTALEGHRGVQRLVRELNRVYRAQSALHQLDFSPEGFEWMAADDADASVFAFLRKPRDPDRASTLLVVCNLTPLPRTNYLLGVPTAGFWREIINSDAVEFDGSGWGNLGGVEATPVRSHGRAHSVCLSLPPLSTLILEHVPHA